MFSMVYAIIRYPFGVTADTLHALRRLHTWDTFLVYITLYATNYADSVVEGKNTSLPCFSAICWWKTMSLASQG